MPTDNSKFITHTEPGRASMVVRKGSRHGDRYLRELEESEAYYKKKGYPDPEINTRAARNTASVLTGIEAKLESPEYVKKKMAKLLAAKK